MQGEARAALRQARLGVPHHSAYPGRVARRSAILVVVPVAAVVVLLDQLTKAWALASIQGQPATEVLGKWLQWSFATNSGAAFSFGRGNTWVFTLVAAVIIVVVLYYTPKVTNRWWAVAMGLILGGGMGNFIDRMIRDPSIGQGHVVDFIRVPNWPIFNVADMAVVSGAVLAVFLTLRGVDYRDRSPAERPAVAESPDDARLSHE